MTRRTWAISFGLACVLVVAIAAAIAKSYVSHRSFVADEPERIAACRTEVLGKLDNKIVELSTLAGVHGLCYARVNEEDTLLEFQIRRNALLNQQVQAPVMLWMVVAITLSGVVLAGLQLVAGYRLASAGKAAFEQGGQLSIESNKLSLSSSVTGLLVLIVSLAFFYIFVSQVYLIKEIGDAPGRSVAGGPDLRAGWGDHTQQPLSFKPGGLVPSANGDSNTKGMPPATGQAKQ